MDFNIRAMALVESVPLNASIDIRCLFGEEVDFRAGLSYSATMPGEVQQFDRVPQPEKLYSVLKKWARVYRYAVGEEQILNILASLETEAGALGFYRLDCVEPKKPRHGPRPPVEIRGGSVLTYRECASWLIDLAERWGAEPRLQNQQLVISRPCAVRPRDVRIAWVVRKLVENRSILNRMRAIGMVYGARIVHIEPRKYRDTEARLAGAMPYEAVVICRHHAPHITEDAVPQGVPRELIHFCDSREVLELENQIRTWIEVTVEELENRRKNHTVEEEQLLLNIMLRQMISHSKIGEFNHCPREDVLKAVRGRRLNVPLADRILDDNCMQYQDSKDSDSLFLCKAHNDGPQFFLNTRKVEDIKVIITPSDPTL